jgi:heme exporter protein D
MVRPERLMKMSGIDQLNALVWSSNGVTALAWFAFGYVKPRLANRAFRRRVARRMADQARAESIVRRLNTDATVTEG